MMTRVSAAVAASLTALGTLFAGAPAMAEEESYPQIEVEISTELEYDRVFDVPAGGKRLHHLFTDSEATVELKLSPTFALTGHAHVEPVKDPSGDSFFKSHGLYLEKIYATYAPEPFKLKAGKLNPPFGMAWDRAPGVFGTDFAEDYELTEGIGARASITFENEDIGTHELGATVFFFDNTFLSSSAFTRPRIDDPFTARPGRLRKRDGGPGNTNAPESFTVTLDGEKIPALPELVYTVGFAYFAKGETETREQKGFVAGVAYELSITEEISFTPIFEYARFWDAGGQPGNIRYYTLGGELGWNQWLASGSVTWRDNSFPIDEESGSGGKFTDRLLTFSVGYQLTDDLVLSAGWKRERIERQDTDTFGVLLAYGYKFSL